MSAFAQKEQYHNIGYSCVLLTNMVSEPCPKLNNDNISKSSNVEQSTKNPKESSLYCEFA